MSRVVIHFPCYNKAVAIGSSILILHPVIGSAGGENTVSTSYTYTYSDAEYTGMNTITFRMADPEMEAGGNGTGRIVIFEGGNITGAEVTSGNLGEGDGTLMIDQADGTVSLDTRGVLPGETITVKVTRTLGSQVHRVTVSVTAEENGDPGEAEGGIRAPG